MHNKKTNDADTSIQELKEIIATFIKERDWQQFHTPKNLSMSIAIEAAELMEKFQFVSPEESITLAQSHKSEIAHELVDVLAYIMSFANVAGIDIASTYREKMALNGKKYPANASKGDFGKYTKLKQ